MRFNKFQCGFSQVVPTIEEEGPVVQHGRGEKTFVRVGISSRYEPLPNSNNKEQEQVVQHCLVLPTSAKQKLASAESLLLPDMVAERLLSQPAAVATLFWDLYCNRSLQASAAGRGPTRRSL